MLRKKKQEEESKWEALYSQSCQEVKVLREQVLRLQEALISKEAPQAYEQLVIDRDPEVEQKAAAWSKIEEENKMIGQYLEQIEKPLFSSGEDLIEALAETMGAPEIGKASLHSNEES